VFHSFDLFCVVFIIRDVAVKFNDYFEFPREFDMEPYTAEGLARIESMRFSCGVVMAKQRVITRQIGLSV
jgi:ubiquitin carboxyl-terminal hydrolase 9/24